jgi:hypothetical protein
MVFGVVIVFLGIYGRVPAPRSRQLAGGTAAFHGSVARPTAAAADLADKMRFGVNRGGASVQKQPERDATAIAEDTMAALLSELLTLREEVEGLRNQIESSQKPAPRKTSARAAAKPSRRIATAPSA